MALTKAQAKSLSILEIARILGMEMKRNSHKEYYWKDHDSFKIDTYKNTWHWYSRGTYGDTINLVQEIRQVSYADAMKFLETGQFPEAKPMEEVRQPFRYSLNSYEQPFREARNYLKEVRSLSDETINFFLEKGVLAQARRRDRDGFTEDVLVFKYLDKSQTIVGASLQGLSPYPERYEGKGYLKQIMYQSEGIAGLNVSIGSPKRLIVAEAPIDLMSYYELHKDQLEDVRLVAMEGLKEGIVSRYAMEALQEQGILVEDGRDYTKARDLTKTSQFLAKAAQRSTLFHDHKQDNLITLAVDNDKAGTDFIETLREKKIPIIDARPPKGEGDRKMDWNQYLKENQTERKAMTEDTKKAPEPILEQEKKEGTNVSWGSLQPKAEGSPAPVAETSTTFEQTVTSHPTISPRLLHFTTDNAHVSIIRDGYHIATEEDLRNLNAYAPILQQTAQWYLTTLAGSSVTYVYQEDGKVDAIKINYDKDKFMHLTGIRPIGKNLTAERLVERFAAGDGHFANILVNRGFISKAQVLPLFEEIIQAKSFMFTNIADIKK